VIDVEEAWTYFREITKAVQYIHQNGVIHRDLKPANIFLGPPGTCQVMIGDFGHSCWLKNYVDGKKGTPSRGTPLYSAPELKNTSDITDKVVFLPFIFCNYSNSYFT
jgi:serine/threonine protein kinase